MRRWFVMFDRRAMLLLPLLLTGCVGVIVGGFIWETREFTGALVWSDDGQRVAGIHASYEITVNADPPIIPGRVRNARYQLFICDLNGSGKQVLGSERVGRLESAFYMKQAGYVLGKEHLDETGTMQFLKWSLTGGEPQVLWRLDRPQYDAFIRLVPSRDGKVLAQCRLSAEGVRDGKVTVLISLLNAATLTSQAEAAVPMRCDSESSLDIQWLPDGRLRVTCFVQRDAAVVAADGSVTRVPVPRELGQATSSSQINARGQFLQGFKPDGSVDTFGGGNGN